METGDWLNDVVSWSASQLTSSHYIKSEQEWESFKEDINDFVNYYFESQAD